MTNKPNWKLEAATLIFIWAFLMVIFPSLMEWYLETLWRMP